MSETYTYNGKPIQVLLVEDDDVDAKGIERAFRRSQIGNPIHRAEDGLKALSMLKGENGYEKICSPFVALVDLNLPGISGIEFIQRLRNDEALKHAIVFVITTSKLDNDKIAAYNLNVAGYILKDDMHSDYSRQIELLQYYWRVNEFPA